MLKKCLNNHRFWLLLILVLAFVLRLYRFDFPLADWHSWRQADTSAVSRNFIKKGFDFLHPRFDDLSKLNSGLSNPHGYRFAEFPIYNFFQAGLFRVWPAWKIETWGRLISIGFSLCSLIFLYLIVEKWLTSRLALWSAFFWAVLPFNVYYSRVILPEPLAIMASLGMLYFFGLWLENDFQFERKQKIYRHLVLGVFFAAVAFLVKPFTLVFILPIFYQAWRCWGFNRHRWWFLFLAFLVAFLPFFAWRLWMRQFPEGIPDARWFFNAGGLRFKGAWFWWLFGERIGKLILGGWGLILLGLGTIVKPKREGWYFHAWLLCVLVYFTTVASANVYHDYYQTLAVPAICVFLAKGADFLLTVHQKCFSRTVCYLLLVVSLFFSLAFSWYQVRDYFNVNNPLIVEAGQALDQLAPPDARVVAPYGGDTAFLYQTNRQGWPLWLDYHEINLYQPDFLVTVKVDEKTEELIDKYCLLKRTSGWVIVDLRKTCTSKT